MDRIQLSYFRKVAELEHMTMAAELLNISQPALSRSIRLLEEELGIKLFDRIGRKLVLNESGRRLYEASFAFEQDIEHICLSVQERPEIHGEVSVLLFTENTRLNGALADFCLCYPGIVLMEDTVSGEPQMNADADFLFYATSEKPFDSEDVFLLEEPYTLAVRADLPIAQLDRATLSDACDLPFVLPSPSHALHERILRLCEAAGFSPICRAMTSHYSVVMSMVEQSGCAALIPQYAPGIADHPSIRRIPLHDSSLSRALYLHRSAHSRDTEAVKAFEEYLLARIRSRRQSGRS